jgi:hypothetical protein
LAYVKEAGIVLDFSEVTLPPEDDLAMDKKDDDPNSFSAKLTRTPALDDHATGGHEENLFSLTWEVVAPLKYDKKRGESSNQARWGGTWVKATVMRSSTQLLSHNSLSLLWGVFYFLFFVFCFLFFIFYFLYFFFNF